MKNIIFDIGMVLVDFHWKSTMEKLGIPADVIDTLDHNMINHPMWNHFDMDDMPEPELIKRFKELSPECSSYIGGHVPGSRHVAQGSQVQRLQHLPPVQLPKKTVCTPHA